jgi:hypothetical protein
MLLFVASFIVSSGRGRSSQRHRSANSRKGQVMVYGLNVKPEHGYYVDTKEIGGSFDRVELVDPTPDGGYTPQGLYSGRHIKTDTVPKQMQWLDPHGHPVPDFDRQRCLNVSARAKALIEEYEPGVHQFVPVEYLDRTAAHLENRFFLIVGNRIDSLDHEKTTMVLRKGRIWTPVRDLVRDGEPLPPGVDPDTLSKMVFNRSQIGSAHMWCDKHLSIGGPYISDELANALKQSGFTGLALSEHGVETV